MASHPLCGEHFFCEWFSFELLCSGGLVALPWPLLETALSLSHFQFTERPRDGPKKAAALLISCLQVALIIFKSRILYLGKHTHILFYQESITSVYCMYNLIH